MERETCLFDTKRLILRHLERSDLDSLFALYSDPEVRRYFPEGTLTYEETREELEWFLNGHPKHPELGLWATIHRESNHFIGRGCEGGGTAHKGPFLLYSTSRPE